MARNDERPWRLEWRTVYYEINNAVGASRSAAGPAINEKDFMAQESQDYPPNARRILNEIMTLLFAPEAVIYKGVPSARITALTAQFERASKQDVTTVKSLLSELVGQLEMMENRIELREIEESERAFQARLEAQEERHRAMEPIRAARLRREGQEIVREWLVTDQEAVLQKIKSKELLTLPEFLEARGVSKRTLSIAVGTGRMFCVVGPNGQNYYPVFFVDSSEYIRQCLGKVCRAIGSIPPYAKYQFFTTNSHWMMGGGTPLDAIRSGRVNDVLQASKWLLQSD